MSNEPSPLDPSVYTTDISLASIRLLQFSRNTSRDGPPTSTFTGKLKTFRLAEAPPFYTASYVWGEKDCSDNISISLESGTLHVLNSLAPLLKMVSKHKDFSEDQWWWIDSLSINLQDVQEREAQVRIMGDIYRAASRVIIWLGEEQESGSDCTGATYFLLQLSNLSPAFRVQKTLCIALVESRIGEQWSAVGRLLSRRWWTRVWTLQEFVLPPEAKFYCGPHGISRGKFKSAMYNIHLCSTASGDYVDDLIPRSAFDAAFNRRRIHQWYLRSGGMSLVAVLAYLGSHSATDARDKLYSVLGLINERDVRLVGDAEYKSSVAHVYSKLVRSFWAEYQSLDIICFVHMFNQNSGNLDSKQTEGGDDEAVPSWAPDWRARVEFSSPVPLMASQSSSEHIGNFRPLGSSNWSAVYDAPGSELRKRANVGFHENLTEMWCSGVVLDSIGGLSGLQGCESRCRSYVCRDSGHEIVQTPQIQKTQDEERSAERSLEIIKTVARSLVLDRRDRYLRYPSPEHYVSTFLVLCYACISLDNGTSTEINSGPIDELFLIWFRQNQYLRLSGQTLAEHITAIASTNPTLLSTILPPTLQHSSPLSPNPTGLDQPGPSSDSEGWDAYLNRFYDIVRKKSRKLMVTSLGYVGVAPCRAQLGDVVAVLFGCSIPLVLRRVGAMEAWEVVGEAYVDGFMLGEVEKLVRGGMESALYIATGNGLIAFIKLLGISGFLVCGTGPYLVALKERGDVK